MRLAERVTFGGGGGLDRAAHLRSDRAALADLRSNGAARALPLWQGKPLVCADGLGWLAADHPVLASQGTDAVFLGLAGGHARFAVDLSDWQPADLPGTLGAFADPSEQRHPDLPEDHVFAELRREMTRLSALDAEFAATARAILGWHATHRFCARCGAESRVIQAGWQRDCPSCGGQHFPRTDPVVIMLITHGNSVLLGRSPGWPEGMFSLLAGFVEPGETIEAAVRREVMEEAGIPVGPVSYLASQPWPFPASLMIGCHGHATAREITLDPVELEAARWITREDLLAAFAGERDDILPARKGAIAHFILGLWLADRLD
ncbi:NAD(+) diphosphatase [Rhodovulum euryhalinum]|uniref:NAD(+) diphosphatase n=1 Tax=Rhodovulum euryhalinum TaxID=35805 RepID=A0A4R2KMI4_9RHOB|nr:NAD(+) diphosphatase [Rhodovulum euryhalinum]TCO71959.1 NAD+ diphosphatase [Rhodovulum euryhalinum]